MQTARGRKSEIAAALDHLVTATDARVLFLTFQSSAGNVDDSDTSVGRSIQRLMRRGDRAAHAPADLTPSVMQALLSECDLVVAMRLHAVILAGNVGTPVVAISYADKVIEAARQLGVEDVRTRVVAPDCGIVDRVRNGRARVQRTDSCDPRHPLERASDPGARHDRMASRSDPRA
jgi:polysaccharide pyruvyl transferase WcaK-like protein